MKASEEIKTAVRQALNLPRGAKVDVLPLLKGGSSRSFFRIKIKKDTPQAETFIFMKYGKEREENACYAGVAEFLESIGVRVPLIYFHDPLKGFAVVEDLGDIDLWSIRTRDWSRKRGFYQETLRRIHILHRYPASEFPFAKWRLMEGFGPALYRWEHSYFLENFVEAFCGIETTGAGLSNMQGEMDAVISHLDKEEKCLVHRDLQSQNVMLVRGEPALIDFQGMRLGTFFYDLASLLYDPYVCLSEEERIEMVRFYFESSSSAKSWSAFLESFRIAGVQRLMQALGAYGFVGLKQGKKEFLGYIPAGLDHLIDALGRCDRFPKLTHLGVECRQAVEEGRRPAE